MQGYILIANTTKKQFECIWTPGTCPKPPYKEYTIGKAGYCGTCPDGCATCSYDTNS